MGSGGLPRGQLRQPEPKCPPILLKRLVIPNTPKRGEAGRGVEGPLWGMSQPTGTLVGRGGTPLEAPVLKWVGPPNRVSLCNSHL